MRKSFLSALGIGAMMAAMSMQSTNANTNKDIAITNPNGAESHKATTPIGTPIPRHKKRLFGSEPQSHAKRHTNRLNSRTKAKHKAKRK